MKKSKKEMPYVSAYIEYMELANQRRGTLINACINLERFMDDVFAFYFFLNDKNKREEFFRNGSFWQNIT